MNKPVKKEGFVFTRENYRILFVGLGLLALGFLLMIGGSSDDPNKFNPEVFNARRLTIAPILILSGFAVVVVAIMKKKKTTE